MTMVAKLQGCYVGFASTERGRAAADTKVYFRLPAHQSDFLFLNLSANSISDFPSASFHLRGLTNPIRVASEVKTRWSYRWSVGFDLS